MFDNMKIGKLAQTGDPGGLPNSKKRRCRTAKEAASEGNLRRRRLKNKTEKLFMKRIRGREGSESCF